MVVCMSGPIALPIAIGRLEHLIHTQLVSIYHSQMPLVYILYSKIIDGYYIGYTIDTIENRIKKHLNNFYKNKYTAKAKDWVLYLKIDCETNDQARRIENHIKKMKSKKYINDLIKYPEILTALLAKYS